jgi:formylglycine-generating enzyme required for sulfatase activity
LLSILILVLFVTFIVGLGVHRMYLEIQKADLYAAGEAALAAHQWNEALAQFEMLSVLDPHYRHVGERLNETHYLTGIAYLETEQFGQAVSEFSQVALDYKDAEDKLAQAFDGSMVHVPAGDFIMGNDAGNPDEHPRRRVYLDACQIDQYEVTNVQYRRFIQATPVGRPHRSGPGATSSSPTRRSR